jgi:hypothetical protein
MTTPLNTDGMALSPGDWEEVHATVQKALAALAEQVQASCPTIRSRGGKTSARAWLLFSYRVFQPPQGCQADPVVAGVDFRPGKGGIVIKGDLCGEEGGEILYELDREAAPTKAAVLEAAQDIAKALTGQAAVVVRALTTPAAL